MVELLLDTIQELILFKLGLLTLCLLFLNAIP